MFQMVTCSECRITFPKNKNEYNRRIRENGVNARFFCTPKCAGIHVNREKQRPTISVVCSCGKTFLTSTGSTFCSRSCASKYSMTPERYSAMMAASLNTRITSDNLQAIADGLRVREWEKYSYIHDILTDLFIPHSFECCLPNSRWIFDLALYDFCTFIEFDEGYHHKGKQIFIDDEKTSAAQSLGWDVFRIDVTKLERPYSIKLISPFIDYYC